MLAFYYYEYSKTNSSRNVFKKIWKWIKAHSGVTMFGDCGLNLPCGHCPGLCLSLDDNGNNPWTPVSDDYILSSEEYDAGERLIQIALFNDTIMGLTFIHNDLVYNDSVYIYEDFNVGSEVAELFEKDSIIILEGVYDVSYTHSANGSTVLDVISY